MVDVEQKEAIKMKGINRDIRIYSVPGRKEAGKEQTKVTKVTKHHKERTNRSRMIKAKIAEKLEDVAPLRELCGAHGSS